MIEARDPKKIGNSSARRYTAGAMSTDGDRTCPRNLLSPRAIFRRAVRITALFSFAIMCGFFIFAYSVSIMPSARLRDADAIVALTGDEERIAAAVRLLSEGKARRLLISGVHKTTRAPQIMSLTTSRGSRSWSLFSCCVDLDNAHNTEANAAETTNWVRKRGYRSIIVVTSTYHMPRALIELHQAMRDVELVPYPVRAPRLDERWWRDSRTAWVLWKEYMKYITAMARYGANSISNASARVEHEPQLINARAS